MFKRWLSWLPALLSLCVSTITQRFAQDDAVAGQGGPDAFAAFIKKEQARWQEVVNRAGIVIE